MTKKEATALARRYRQYGYFKDRTKDLIYNFCKRCKRRVETIKRLTESEIAAHDRMMLDHYLMEDCDQYLKRQSNAFSS